MTRETARTNRRETFYRVALVVGSLMFGFGILELLAWLEVFDYRGLLAPPESGQTEVADLELLHRHAPHAHIAGSARSGQITWSFQIPPKERQYYSWDVHYDRYGFRNSSDLTQADIAVIGDSFVEGLTIPDAELMTNLLAGMEKQTVANLGQFGYGPLEEIVVLKRYGLPLRPRTVVWMFSEATDLGDVIHYRKKIGQMDAPRHNGKPAKFAIRQAISSIHARVKMALRRATRPPGVLRAGVVRTAAGEPLNEYFASTSQPFTADEMSALDETREVIAEAERLCAAQGARFVFVLIPSKFRAFHDSCEFPAQSECRKWTLTDLPERLRQAVGPVSATVGYRDLTPDLAAAVKRGNFPYYSDDDHWSPAGNRIAAEAIHQYLEEMPR
jgi:hypothetical protein